MSDPILQEIRSEQVKQGKTLARIDERTQQHEKRMDRSDRRAAGVGGLTGLAAGFAAAFMKAFFHPTGGA